MNDAAKQTYNSVSQQGKPLMDELATPNPCLCQEAAKYICDDLPMELDTVDSRRRTARKIHSKVCEPRQYEYDIAANDRKKLVEIAIQRDTLLRLCEDAHILIEATAKIGRGVPVLNGLSYQDWLTRYQQMKGDKQCSIASHFSRGESDVTENRRDRSVMKT